MKILDNVGLSFDDVLLIPQKSSISSRFSGEVDLTTVLVPDIVLKYPIISANMDTVTEDAMAKEMESLGGIGIVHRFLSIENHIDLLKNISGNKVLCIGVGKEEFLRFQTIFQLVKINALLIDIAHGHSEVMLKQIKRIKDVCSVPIIAGNVATYDGVLELLNAGVCSVKVGVGPGSLCTTRIQTGCGVPQMTAIIEARRALEDFCIDKVLNFKPTIIADGGIRYSGDIVKSFAAGADAVMIGNLFAGTEEAPGEKIRGKKGIEKKYRGMASKDAQENWKGYASSVEGEMMFLPYKGQVRYVFEELITGILSGMSYQDAKNLTELKENAEFIKITSAGYKESLPHGIL
ncbi:MAG: IMP dehydrogenase [Patescibacteria group bacterium]